MTYQWMTIYDDSVISVEPIILKGYLVQCSNNSSGNKIRLYNASYQDDVANVIRQQVSTDRLNINMLGDGLLFEHGLYILMEGSVEYMTIFYVHANEEGEEV